MAQNEELGWQHIEEQITCRICGNLFTDPRTLSCSHTFCKACLDKQIKKTKDVGEPCCPLCLEPLPKDGIAAIQANISINCLIKLFNKREEKTDALIEIKCGKCSEDDASVTTWCMMCQSPLCDDCAEAHSNVEECKDHGTVSIKEYVQKPKKTLTPTKKQEFCKKHTKQPLNMYCKNCSIIICHDCAIKGHVQHTFTYVDFMEKEKEVEKQTTNQIVRIIHKIKIVQNENRTMTPKDKSRNYKLYVGKYDYTGDDDDDLSFKKGDQLYVYNEEGDWWLAEAKNSGKEGYIPKNYVALYNSLESEDYFFGAIKRLDAENQLMQPVNEYGSYLVRYSETTPGDYSLAVRDTDRVRHFKITNDTDKEKFYIRDVQCFDSVQDLITFYSKNSNGLSVCLKMPCQIVELPQYADVLRAANEAWETERGSVNFVKKLGTTPGQFGELWEGTWKDAPVAVKIQPDKADSWEFFLEVAVLKDLDHTCIIKLLAVCTKEEPIYIITELMKDGSLLEYLRIDDNKLKLHQKLDILTQVATGMAYLESKCVIHCDLAARNILVSEDSNRLICKITNFGLAQFLSEDIYEAPPGTKFSPKWAAPEAAMHSYFSIKSDVWSFGIFVYELITDGSFPYFGMTNAQVVEALQTGYRMPCPKNCSKRLYNIMKDCWREEAASRPTFETLQWRMEDYFTEDSCNN